VKLLKDAGADLLYQDAVSLLLLLLLRLRLIV
jgi:hypothetical protein